MASTTSNNVNSEAIRRRMRHGLPLGKLVGLLAGCLATLIGIASGHEPFVIFSRALISGVAVAILLSFGLSVIHLANVEPPRTESKP